MNDPFPAIPESSAAGETAGLFADIRTVVGVRVVNLVWRHLATMDGALPLAWAAVRPLYTEGIVDAQAMRFRAAMVLPRLASLAGDEPPGVDAVLASYDHSNCINLFALGALLEKLRGEFGTQEEPAGGPRMPASDLALPPLLSESGVAPETWARVLRLNRLGDQAQPLILASMYRHLAHWPAFLDRLEAALMPAHHDGSLKHCIAVNSTSARSGARVIAGVIELPAVASGLSGQIESALAAFVDHAIGKMVTISRAIRAVRGVGL